jgi:hypothetical protein
METADIVHRHLDSLAQAFGMLHAPGLRERVQLGPGRGEPEVARRLVARADAGLVLEPLKQTAREQRQLNVDRGAVLRAKAAGGTARRTGSRLGAAIDHRDAAAATAREVPGDAGPHHAAAEDHHIHIDD